MEQDYYRVLGLSRLASLSEITSAYLAHSSLWNPANFVDDSPENAEFAKTRYREIEEAYRVLSDPSLRAEYDEHFSEAPSDSEKSSGTSKWKNWLIPACAFTLLSIIPKTCDNIKSRNNGHLNQEKNKRILEYSRVPSQTPYEQGIPTIDVPQLDIPKIEMPKIDKGYSPGSSSEHFGNHVPGVKNE
jgi:hypothetical protein